MKETKLTREEKRYLVDSQRILNSYGIVLSGNYIKEGLVSFEQSEEEEDYWWMDDPDDSADMIDDIKDDMEEIADVAGDLLETVEEFFDEIKNEDVKEAMARIGEKAAESIKSAMSSEYEKIRSELSKIASEAKKKESEDEDEDEDEKKDEEDPQVNGSDEMAFVVMAAASAKVLSELFE